MTHSASKGLRFRSSTATAATWASTRSALIAAVAAVALMGCGGGGDDDQNGAAPPTPSPPASAPAATGNVGGTTQTAPVTITGPGNATITVPPGALRDEVTIRLAQESADAPALPTDVRGAGATIAATPHGLAFNSPVQIELPLPAAPLAATEIYGLMKAQPGGQWEVVPNAVVRDGKLVAEVTSFSYFAIVILRVPTATFIPWQPTISVNCGAEGCNDLTEIPEVTVTIGSNRGALPTGCNAANARMVIAARPGVVTVGYDRDPREIRNVFVNTSAIDALGSATVSFGRMPEVALAFGLAFSPSAGPTSGTTPRLEVSRINLVPYLECPTAAGTVTRTFYATQTIGLRGINTREQLITQRRVDVQVIRMDATSLSGQGRARVTARLSGGAFAVTQTFKFPFYIDPNRAEALAAAVVSWERSDDGGASWTLAATSRQTDGQPFQFQADPLIRDWRYWTVSHDFDAQGRSSGDIRFRVSACITHPADLQNPNPTQLTTTCTRGSPITVPLDAVGVSASVAVPPRPTLVLVNETASFSAVVSGAPSPTLQWQTRPANSTGPWTDVTNGVGATSANHTTPPLALADNGRQFRLLATNSAGQAASPPVTVSVTPTPVAARIDTQPANLTVGTGSDAVFAASATGTEPLSYQWRRNGQDIAGANGPVLRLSGVNLADDGAQLSLVVANAVATVQSQTALLRVRESGAPVAVAPTLVTQPSNVTARSGQTVTFAVGVNGTGPFSFQWRKDGAAVAGATAAVLTLPSAAASDAGSYAVVVSNAAGTVTSNAASLVLAAEPPPPQPVAPTIVTQPANVVALAGNSATFAVAAMGTGPLSYQWSRNGSDIAGATGPVFIVASVQATDAGAYAVRISNAAGTVSSSAGTLIVPGAPGITQQPQGQVASPGQTATFTAAVSGNPTPQCQWTRNGIAIAGATQCASYTTPAVTAADNGAVFNLVAYNTAGAVFATGGVLTVNAGVAVGPPTFTGACFGGPFGWCYVQPAPAANQLTGLAFDPSGAGVTIVGEAGIVLRSTDFGGTVTASWQTQRYSFTALASPSPGRLVAAVDDADDVNVRGIYLSTDDGATWTRTVSTNLTVAIAFRDALVGIAVGAEEILRTTDGGSSWTALNVPEIVPPNATLLTGVAYAGNDVFVASGIGQGLRSTNGGLTWSVVPGMVTANSNLNGVAFNGQGLGLAMNDSQPVAARSTDFGATWSTVNLPFVASRAAYADANTVVILGGDGRHARSTDGGLNWSPEVFSLQTGQQRWRPFMRNAQQGLAIGDYGAIARTEDGGQTWSQIAGGNINQSVWALETNPGRTAMLGQINGGLKRSADGRTWSDVSAGLLSSAFRQSISWGSGTVAVAASTFEGVHITADAGDTWTRIRPPLSTGTYPAVAMANAQTVVVTGHNIVNGVVESFVERSTNAGQSWSRIPLPGLDGSGVTLYAARFVSPTLGFIAGSANVPGGARLWRTEDAGATWLAITLPDVGTNARRDIIQAIQPGPNGTIFMATDSAILRSADTGFNWSRVLDASAVGSMTNVRFSGNVGIAVGVGGIWRSGNGSDWTRLDLPLSGILLATAWAPGNAVLAGGDGGMLLTNASLGVLAQPPNNPSFKQTLRTQAPVPVRLKPQQRVKAIQTGAPVLQAPLRRGVGERGVAVRPSTAR